MGCQFDFSAVALYKKHEACMGYIGSKFVNL